LDGGRKGHDRSRWLNSPNVYQKVEILETGTPDPKKITKWVAEGSPTHSSTPVKIDGALQFVPKGTNPKEFKQKEHFTCTCTYLFSFFIDLAVNCNMKNRKILVAVEVICYDTE
jgi:hypothetical protein